jgi:hypothetical protein
LLPLFPRPSRPQGSTEALPGAEGSGLQNLLINIGGVLLFGGLFTVDSRGAEQRVQQRKAIREAQIRAGDREVFVNEEGENMSKLKEVGVLLQTRLATRDCTTGCTVSVYAAQAVLCQVQCDTTVGVLHCSVACCRLDVPCCAVAVWETSLEECAAAAQLPAFVLCCDVHLRAR